MRDQTHTSAPDVVAAYFHDERRAAAAAPLVTMWSRRHLTAAERGIFFTKEPHGTFGRRSPSWVMNVDFDPSELRPLCPP